MDSTERKPPTPFAHNECGRCDGKGYIRGFEHVQRGVCFACKGAGYFLTKRGHAQHKAWRAAVDAVALRTVAEVVVGDHVRLPSDNKYAVVIGLAQRIDDRAMTLTYDRKVMDCALASCPGLPPDMVYRDGLTLAATSAIYIHPDSALRNPQRATQRLMPKAADFAN